MTSSVWVDPLQLSYEEFLVRHNSMTDDEMRMAWYSNELFKKVIQIAEDSDHRLSREQQLVVNMLNEEAEKHFRMALRLPLQ